MYDRYRLFTIFWHAHFSVIQVRIGNLWGFGCFQRLLLANPPFRCCTNPPTMPKKIVKSLYVEHDLVEYVYHGNSKCCNCTSIQSIVVVINIVSQEILTDMSRDLINE
jgi:hypothetical protein